MPPTLPFSSGCSTAADAEAFGREHCCSVLAAGDTLVAAALDRSGRSRKDLVSMVGELRRRKSGFCSLHERLDTTTPPPRAAASAPAARSVGEPSPGVPCLPPAVSSLTPSTTSSPAKVPVTALAVVRDADHALLDDRDRQAAVLGVDAGLAQAAAARRGR
ncbi:recombinase family protein [Streptomyces coeruleoprunus]|uniref:Recombinase family protein n=1 Tax=Streptomyces coeruleoprunus TaxID=285563 RepID=A0ABV9XPQ7_9ACTN